MHAAVRVLFVVACLALSACFTSREDLIGPDDAAFPFERIVFAEQSRPDDRQTLIRKGDAYSFRPDQSDEREALVRFKDVGGDLYVARMEFTDEGKTERLYALMRADLPAGRVDSFAAIRPDNFVARPGLSICDSFVCIDDLDAYVAFAKATIEAGAEPEAEYLIIERE